MRGKMIAGAMMLAASVFVCNPSNGQVAERGFDWNFVLGVNLGATTPVPVPNELDITGYHPRLNPKIGADFKYYFDEHWGIGAGLSLDWKSLRIRTKVTDVHLGIDVPNLGTLTGYVTGRNKTKINTLYLVQPVYASYRFNGKWNVKAGIYMAESLHRKFKGEVHDVTINVVTPLEQERHINYATLDYSKDARKFDMGLLIGGEFRMNNYVGFFTDFTWGFTPYFSKTVPIHFTMRNVYFSIGATFRI